MVTIRLSGNEIESYALWASADQLDELKMSGSIEDALSFGLVDSLGRMEDGMAFRGGVLLDDNPELVVGLASISGDFEQRFTIKAKDAKVNTSDFRYEELQGNRDCQNGKAHLLTGSYCAKSVYEFVLENAPDFGSFDVKKLMLLVKKYDEGVSLSGIEYDGEPATEDRVECEYDPNYFKVEVRALGD